MSNILILLNYNDADTTIKFITKHMISKYIDKIIVVDNKSTDDSYIRLSSYINNKCDLVITDKNGGYAYGNNYGAFYAIKKYNPDYITIANPDTIISDNVLCDIFECYAKVKNVGLCSCIMRSSSNVRTLSAWKQPTYIDCVVACLFGIKSLFRWHMEYPKSFWSSNEQIKEVDVIAGSFFCVSREAFLAAKGFDDRTFLYYEEAILSKRIKENGYRNYLLLNDFYLHEHAVTINKNIESVGKRLDILHESRKLYCKQYLNIGLFREAILDIAYYVGKSTYIMYVKIKKYVARLFKERKCNG